ncbi:unnamed protein product [Paramecium primaurelia]|uniref:PH domain-containing protein n=1 Tax=Paramecium primaurelia TaxID=5886 RepID=A0A8S1KD24_PARPR|nr:unnamed protein product [Paramecium primaurelia]
MKGYLKKWVKFMYQYQNHYFILHEGSLIYCHSKGSRKKGQVHLSICSIKSVSKDPQRIVINYGMSEMNLRASLVQEKQKWLSIKRKRNHYLVFIYILKQYPFIEKEEPFLFYSRSSRIRSKKHSYYSYIIFYYAIIIRRVDSINNTSKISQLIQEIEVNDLANLAYSQIQQKLQEKIRVKTDHNPPDLDQEEFVPTEQFMRMKINFTQSIMNSMIPDYQQGDYLFRKSLFLEFLHCFIDLDT